MVPINSIKKVIYRVLFVSLPVILACPVPAQVGINNTSPKATLDVTAGSGTEPEGIIAPRLTLKELQSRTYGSLQNGAIVYVKNETDATASGTTSRITSKGYYYYFESGSTKEWRPFLDKAGKQIWNKVGTNDPSTENTDDSFLNAKAVVGGNAIGTVNGGDAQLTVIGGDASINGITVGTGKGNNITNTAIGASALETNTGAYNTAIGAEANSSGTAIDNTVAVGYKATVSNHGAIAIGAKTQSTALATIAIGEGNTSAIASKNTAIAIGAETNASGMASIALGQQSAASNQNATAIGSQARSSGSSAIAIGDRANAGIDNGIAIGFNSTSNKALQYGESNIAIGYQANASGGESVALGPLSKSSNYQSIAIGKGTNASGVAAIAIGSGEMPAQATEKGSIVIGNGAVNPNTNSTFIKNQSNVIGSSMNGYADVTLQIIGDAANSSALDGFMVPMITLAQLNDKTSKYSSYQDGAIIYVTQIDAIPTGRTVQITEARHYYYDSNETVWVKLAMGLRHETVDVNPDNTFDPFNGKYKTLQNAYETEARKMYNAANGGILNFVCSGNVGNLTANGEIPYIQITHQDGKTAPVLGKLVLNNISAILDTPSTGNITIDMIETNNTSIYMPPLTRLKVNKGINLLRSAFYGNFGDAPGANTINTGYITTSLSYIGLNNCDVTIPDNINNAIVAIDAANSSYIEFGDGCTIDLKSGRDFGLRAINNGVIKNKGFIEINAIHKYDIYATSTGAILFADASNITGESNSTNFMTAINFGRISIYASKITRSKLKAFDNDNPPVGFQATDGGELFINAWGVNGAMVSPIAGSSNDIGVYVNGGEVKVAGGR